MNPQFCLSPTDFETTILKSKATPKTMILNFKVKDNSKTMNPNFIVNEYSKTLTKDINTPSS